MLLCNEHTFVFFMYFFTHIGEYNQNLKWSVLWKSDGLSDGRAVMKKIVERDSKWSNGKWKITGGLGAGNCRCHVVLLKWRLHSRLGTNLDKGSKINYECCITPDLLLLPLSFSLGRSSSSVSNLNGSSATGCEGKNYLLLLVPYGLTTGQSNLLFKLVIIKN